MQNQQTEHSNDLELELKAESNNDFEQQYLDQCLRETVQKSDGKHRENDVFSQRSEVIDQINSPFSDPLQAESLNIKDKDSILLTQHSKSQSFIVIFYVKQFLEHLRLSRLRILKLNSTHFNLIGDKASDLQIKHFYFYFSINLVNYSKTISSEGFSVKSIQKLLQIEQNLSLTKISVFKDYFENSISSIKRWLDYILEMIPLIYPECLFKTIWEYITTIFRIILIILVPLQISFHHDLMFKNQLGLTVLIITILISDLVIRSNTICYLNGCVIKDRWEIMRNYLKSQFFRDLLCILILLFFTFYQNVEDFHNLILLVCLDQYKYVYVVYANSDQLSYLSRPQRGILGLFKLISTLLQILHIYSCIWFWISKQNQDDSWIVQKQLEQSSWGLQYLESLYFAVVTMLTIGYGDNVPKTSNEKITTIVFILVACVWFSYSVNFIGNIINDITQNQVERNQKMRIINKYMNERKIPYGLQHQIKEYLTYRWKEDDEVDLEQEQELLQQLSDELKEELDKQVHKVFIEKSEVLKNYFTNEFRVALFKSIKRKIISPQNIFNIEFNDQLNLCYIEQGAVLFQHQEEKQRGKMNAVIDKVNSYNKENLDLFKAIGYVSLLVLSKQDFINTLKDYPEDYQRYCQLKDNSQFNGQNLTHSLLCPACLNNQHNLENCPYIQFMPDRELIVKRSLFNQSQARHHFVRLRQKKHKFMTLLEADYIQEFAKLFQQENNTLVQNQLKLQLIYDQNTYTIITDSPQLKQSPSLLKQPFDQKQRSPVHSARLKPIAAFRMESDIVSNQQDLKNANQRIIKRMSNTRILQRKKTRSDSIRLIDFLDYEDDDKSSIKNMAIFNQEQEENIINIYKKIQQEYESDETQELKLYLAQLEPLYQKVKYNEINDFELLKQFDYYFPNDNICNILPLVENKQFQWQYRIINRFVNYLIHPFQYILKFLKLKRTKSIVKQKLNNPIIQRVKNKLRMVQLRQSFLTSRMNSNKNIRTSQVFPISVSSKTQQFIIA